MTELEVSYSASGVSLLTDVAVPALVARPLIGKPATTSKLFQEEDDLETSIVSTATPDRSRETIFSAISCNIPTIGRWLLCETHA